MAKELSEYDKLEGTYQIIRLKRLERYAFIPQVIGIIMVFALFTYLEGAQMVPFYFPVFLSMLVVSIWILVLSIEFFVFRLMEINFRKSESAKFLMASRSMKKATTGIVIFGILCLILFTPFMTQVVSSYSSPEEEININGREEITFTSRGRFNFMMVESIEVEILDEGEMVEVSVWDKPMERKLNRNVGDPTQATMDEAFEYDMPELKFEEYVLVMETSGMARVRYRINYHIPSSRMFPFALISLGFLISNAVFAALMQPIKKMHADKAIYR